SCTRSCRCGSRCTCPGERPSQLEIGVPSESSFVLFLCSSYAVAASPRRRGIAYRHHSDVELERHPGEWVIGIDHHEAVLFVDLGDHHVLRAATVLALREKTHPRFDLVDAAKLLGGHPLLQRLVALAISIFGR